MSIYFLLFFFFFVLTHQNTSNKPTRRSLPLSKQNDYAPTSTILIIRIFFVNLHQPEKVGHPTIPSIQSNEKKDSTQLGWAVGRSVSLSVGRKTVSTSARRLVARRPGGPAPRKPVGPPEGSRMAGGGGSYNELFNQMKSLTACQGFSKYMFTCYKFDNNQISMIS